MEDAIEWLKRWDAGEEVPSLDMGGMGRGYELCIQSLTAELLRHLLDKRYDQKAWKDQKTWEVEREQIKQFAYDNLVFQQLGPSYAQYGAALSLATNLYMRGPTDLMNDPAYKDRHIQVRKP